MPPDFELQNTVASTGLRLQLKICGLQVERLTIFHSHLGGSGVLAYFAGSLESRGGPCEGIEVSGDAFQRRGFVPTLTRTRSWMTTHGPKTRGRGARSFRTMDSRASGHLALQLDFRIVH